MDVSFLCVCPNIDREFRHNIVKVAGMHEAISEWIRRQFDNVVTKLIVNNRTDSWKTDVNLCFTMCLSTYWQWKLANERVRNSAVIVRKSLDILTR